MGKQIIADNLTLGTQLGRSATEINGFPEDLAVSFFFFAIPYTLLYNAYINTMQCER